MENGKWKISTGPIQHPLSSIQHPLSRIKTPGTYCYKKSRQGQYIGSQQGKT